jgi:hypothetical protein
MVEPVHTRPVRSFDEMLADFLEEPEEVLGVLNDLVVRGRMQADTLDGEALQILASYDLVAYLIQRSPGRPVRAWVYPSPLGLKVFALLEREAEREAEREKQLHAKPRSKRRSGKSRA